MNLYHILVDELIAAAAVSPDSISASQRREEIKQGRAWMHGQPHADKNATDRLVKLSAANLKCALCHLS